MIHVITRRSTRRVFLSTCEIRAGYIRSQMMTVTVLLFASYADALGRSAIVASPRST